jgi:hypothetical protein
MATDTIVMGPNSSIGGSLPITVSTEGAQGADQKFISVFNAEMRKTAKSKGHPVDIAMGFCDPDTVIPGLKEKGEIEKGGGTCVEETREDHLTDGESLVAYAEKEGVDAVFVGVQKVSKVGKLLFGSTAQYVILSAPCPVVSVRG